MPLVRPSALYLLYPLKDFHEIWLQCLAQKKRCAEIIKSRQFKVNVTLKVGCLSLKLRVRSISSIAFEGFGLKFLTHWNVQKA